MSKVVTIDVDARVLGDGTLRLKLPVRMAPGDYPAVVTLGKRKAKKKATKGDPGKPTATLAEHVEAARRQCLRLALERCGGNRSRAARLLGVDPRTVFRLVTEFDL